MLYILASFVKNKLPIGTWVYLWAISEDIMRNAGLEEKQAGIKIAGRNVNNLRYADDTTLMAKAKN